MQFSFWCSNNAILVKIICFDLTSLVSKYHIKS